MRSTAAWSAARRSKEPTMPREPLLTFVPSRGCTEMSDNTLMKRRRFPIASWMPLEASANLLKKPGSRWMLWLWTWVFPSPLARPIPTFLHAPENPAKLGILKLAVTATQPYSFKSAVGTEISFSSLPPSIGTKVNSLLRSRISSWVGDMPWKVMARIFPGVLPLPDG